MTGNTTVRIRFSMGTAYTPYTLPVFHEIVQSTGHAAGRNCGVLGGVLDGWPPYMAHRCATWPWEVATASRDSSKGEKRTE